MSISLAVSGRCWFYWSHLPHLSLPICLLCPPNKSASIELRGLIRTSHLRLSALKLVFTQCPVADLCVNYHILEEETSLMRAEICSAVYINMTIGIILLLYSFSIMIVVGFSLQLLNEVECYKDIME